MRLIASRRSPASGPAGEGGQDRFAGPALADRLQQPRLVELQAAVEEVFFGREVVEHGLARDVGGAGDVGDGDGVEAMLLEQAPRGLRDQAPGLQLLALAEP
jgi:hypothetical protein